MMSNTCYQASITLDTNNLHMYIAGRHKSRIEPQCITHKMLLGDFEFQIMLLKQQRKPWYFEVSCSV